MTKVLAPAPFAPEPGLSPLKVEKEANVVGRAEFTCREWARNDRIKAENVFLAAEHTRPQKEREAWRNNANRRVAVTG